MDDDGWRNVRKIFESALVRRPEERRAFVLQVCGDNETLLAEVESLLSSLDSADSFLETPAVAQVLEAFEGDEKKLEKGRVLGHYKIIVELGAGGMGEVYLAKDQKLDRHVAVKILNHKFSNDEVNLNRFVREAKAASALNHPNILVIHEIGEADGTHYIVSEYVEGETLRKICRERPLRLTEVLDVSIQVAGALSTAHQAHLVHRDIKPENLMVRPDGYVKILDFGLAKLIEQSDRSLLGFGESTAVQDQTAKGLIMGTVNYMSPEQARGGDVDERTDIFSLAVVIYEMVAGRTPFAGDSMAETFANLINAEPHPMAWFASDVPAELERIVSKALSKDRDQRHRHIKDLLIEIKNLKREIESGINLEHGASANKQDFGITPSINDTSHFPPNNLSLQTATIIGREKEIVQIKDLLRQDDVRLLTMTGVGGTGKTVLAKSVARELFSDFADGIFFIDLAPITDSELVASTIAQALGFREAGGTPILEILKNSLHEKRLLLVIDNFEQVADAAPQIAQLLSAAPRLTILITSRVFLHLSLEREFPVPTLAVPSKSQPLSTEELLNFESISLFVERAKLANPSFALSEENARDISRICARLDGLPLAIELAAARMKILSPPIILSKLKDSLKLLTDGACDLPARQQTMRGAIEWSYDLLGEDEKSLFRQLSVFAGGSSLESAEEVCGSNDKAKEEQREVFEVLTSLVNKNLLFSKEHANGNVRFRMLGVVREYALEALEASGETQAMRRSHAEYFLALGEEAEPHLRASKTVEWPNRLEEELDNFRSALRWSLANHPEIAARLISATRVFWILHNHLTEGSGWLKAALATSHNSSVAVRSKLRGALAHAALLQGDYETTQEMHEISLAEGELANDKQQIALATCGLGISAFHQGDYDKARKYYEEGLTMSRGLNNEFGIVQSLNVLGDLARIKGDNAKARELSGEALEISRKLGSKELVSASLNNMGAIVFAENDYDASCAYFTESMLMARELGYKIQLSYSLDGFAALAEKQGELQRATRLAGAAENLRDSIGSKIEPAEQYLRDTYLEKIRAAMDASLFSESYEEGRRMTLDRAITLALEGV